MSISLTLYTNSSSPNTLDKSNSLTAIASDISIDPTEEFSILKPEIVLAYSSTYIPCNYAKLVFPDSITRYYFAKTSVDTGGRLILSCSADVLMTFKDSILNCSVTVIRNESVGVTYVPDDKLPIDPNRYDTHGKYFPNSLGVGASGGKDYLLITNG